MNDVEVLEDKPVKNEEIVKLAQQIVKQIEENEQRSEKFS